MKKCKSCEDRTEECPTGPDGALLALGPFWGGADRECPKELEEWKKEAEAALRKKPAKGRRSARQKDTAE